jgi:S1-C subfamily serine protease
MMRNRFFQRWLSVGLTAIALLTSGTPVWANAELFHRVLPRCAWVVLPGRGWGSGVLVDDDRRLLVTNYHVVKEQGSAQVFFPRFDKAELIRDRDYYQDYAGELAIRGTVLKTAPKLDLAVLQLDRLPRGLEALPLSYFSARRGQTVYSIGNSGAASGRLWNFREGTVRGVVRTRFLTSGGEFRDVRMVDSVLHSAPGDSGGPLFNERGQLVGITAMARRDETLSVDIEDVWAVLLKR